MIKEPYLSLIRQNSSLTELLYNWTIKDTRKKRSLHFLIVIAFFLIPTLNFGQSPPNLGSASSFALFTAAGAFNNGGATEVVGNIGTNVGAFAGFPPGIVIGQIHVADPASAQAATDVDNAYNSMSTITCGSVISTTLGSGQTLLPNVYCMGAASTINGDLILDGQGNPNSLFIFKIDGALATTVNSRVLLTNSASICNVYWQVNGEVDLGNNSLFQGTILANGAINLLDGATLNGRGLSRAGAISLSDNIVNIPTQPVASITTSGGVTSFCAGGSVILTADSATSYLWSTGATTRSITVTTGGNYFVTVSNGCFSNSDTILVTVNPPPNVNAGVDEMLTCLQASITLNGSSSTAGVTFSYVASGGGNIVSGANTATPTVNTAGTYILTVTNTATGCSASDTVVVTTSPSLPNVNAGADQVLTCLQTSVVLNGSSSTPGVTFSYVASGGGNIVSGANTATPTVNAAGTYTLTVTDPTSGCSASDVVIVTLNTTLPNVNAGADAVITCSQTSVVLNGSSSTPGVTFSYVASGGGNIVSGANTATPTVNAAGTYTLTVTDPVSGCSASDVVIVTLNTTLPNVNAGADEVITCSQTSVVLNGSSSTPGATFSYVASGGGNIVSGANTATPTVSSAGTYTLTVTDPINGCSASDVVIVTLNTTLPNVNAGTDAVITCSQTSVVLNGSSSTPGVTFSYVASGGGNIVSGANTATPTVNAAGTYTLTVTDPVSGCSASDVVVVTSNTTLSNCLITNDTCGCGEIQLCAPSGYTSYSWNTGETTSCITATSTGTFSVTVTDSKGCSSTCSEMITVSSAPSCLITNDTCGCGTIDLCAPKGYTSYAWNTGEVTSCVSATSTGTFSVTVTDSKGRTNTCSQTITINSTTAVVNGLLSNSSLNVFPNPVNETANVQLDLPERCEGNLILYDINGNVLYESIKGTIEQKSQYSIPMSQFSSGIYVLKLYTDKGTLVKKIVK